jgi:tetratricopeptide (TPR) repeat protein
VPFLNEHYFKIENLSELRREAGNRFQEINKLQAMGETAAARDSIMALVEYFEKRDDDVSKTATQLGLFQLASNYKQFAVSKDDYKAAIRQYQKLLDKFPKTLVAEQVFMMIARCHITLADMGLQPEKNYQKAIETLEIIERNRPEAANFPKYKFTELTPGAYFNIDKGRTKAVNRNLAKALYTKAEMIRDMATDTTQVSAELLSDAVLLIGDCYSKLGQGEKAREQYSIIIKYFEESDLVDNAQKAVGESFEYEADKLREKAALETDAAKKQAMQAQANALYMRAAETYLKFINVYLQSGLLSKVHISLGGVYFKLSQDKDAYKTFAQAINSIKVIEEQAKVQLDIGNYYADQKKWDNAIENYAKVLQNYSNTEFASNAQYLLAKSYESKGDTNEALKAYNDVCENFRSSTFYPASAFEISKVYIRQKDYSKAQKYLRQSVSLFPESPVAPQTQYQLGLIYKDMAEGADSTEADLKYRLAIKEFATVTGTYSYSSDWVEKSVLAMGECYMKIGLKDQARSTLDGLRSQTAVVEKFRILGIEGSDSAIVKDYEEQLEKLTEGQAKAQVYIEIGRKLKGEELGLLDSAIAVFNMAIDLSEDTVTRMTAYGELGDCYMKKGEYRRARAVFNDEILKNPRCEEARAVQFAFKVAETYFRDKDHAEAVNHFTAFVEKNPEHDLAPPALYLLGKSHSVLGDHAKAIKQYKKFLKQYPESDMIDNVGLGYGEALQGQKKFKAAIDHLLDFLKKHPDLKNAPSFHFKIAEIYRKDLADADASVPYYEKVLKFPDAFLFSASAYQLGRIFAGKQEDDKAIAAYEQVKRGDIEYFRAAQGEIGSLKAKTDPEGAIQNYEKIESSSDDVADKVIARMGIGDVYAAQKKYQDAVESYTIIYERYVDAEKDLRAAAIIKIIDALNNSQKHKEILDWANRMIREFPDNRYTVNAYYFRANAYYALKRYGKARKAFLDVIDKDTTMLAEIARYQRAECLLSMKKHDAAVSEFDMFIKRFPKSNLVANALFQKANVLWGREQYKKAKSHYIKILKKYPKFQAACWAKNYLAFCYDKENKWRKAKNLYHEVTKKACDKEAVKFAKEQIRAINVKH